MKKISVVETRIARISLPVWETKHDDCKCTHSSLYNLGQKNRWEIAVKQLEN